MNQFNYYPNDTTASIKLASLIKLTDKRLLSEKMSSRMIKCASVMGRDGFIGWQMVVPTKGIATVTVFGSNELTDKDLEWISEKTGKASRSTTKTYSNILGELYEVYLPIAEENTSGSSIGFGNSGSKGNKDGFYPWPAYYSGQFAELVSVLRESGAALRVVIGSASVEEQTTCRKNTLRSYDVDKIPIKDYVGHPVRIRVLLRLPSTPSIRLKTVLEESVQGAQLRKIDVSKQTSIWNMPLNDAAVLPDYAARILMLEPEVYDATVALQTCEEPVKVWPVSHKITRDSGAVEIGKAIDTAGIKRRITIGEMDIRRHYQIVGQTGCGKSTLLASMILSAIEQGHGLTFFDPHGTTIDVVLRSVQQKYADRVRVVRIGDADNPVPLNIWDSDDPDKEERNIADLCELFSDIFDPERQGVVGPRYERWLSTFAKASIAFLGRRASLESIAVISQSQDNMLKVCKAIASKYPQLFEIIKEEYGKDKSSDFNNILGWYLCKFQRLTSVEQMRKTLGAGTNALDFGHSVDTDTVMLIDLASPQIGTRAARIIGTLVLMKLWNAVMARQQRDKTHIVVVDEAALFQTNPMPRMLAEGRKFGLSMVLCHQHTGQLTQEIRDALESNSANFSAFRLSPKDAHNASIRFDDENILAPLTRLDAYNCITTLSVNGQQSAPFTMRTIRPKPQKNGEAIAAYIERRSIETLVKPYKEIRALTAAEIQLLLNDPDKRKWLSASDSTEKVYKKDSNKTSSKKRGSLQGNPSKPDVYGGIPSDSDKTEYPDWLYNYSDRRKKLIKAS